MSYKRKTPPLPQTREKTMRELMIEEMRMSAWLDDEKECREMGQEEYVEHLKSLSNSNLFYKFKHVSRMEDSLD
jgi:hypothetical protein